MDENIMTKSEVEAWLGENVKVISIVDDSITLSCPLSEIPALTEKIKKMLEDAFEKSIIIASRKPLTKGLICHTKCLKTI